VQAADNFNRAVKLHWPWSWEKSGEGRSLAQQLIGFDHGLQALFARPVTAIAVRVERMDQFAVTLAQGAAVGVQLDAVGLWVGQSRSLAMPLTDVYFTFDTEGLGFDQGAWQGPYDPATGLVSLADDAYRTLLRAKIAANHWDGGIPDAYAVWGIVFAGTGLSIAIQDYENMSMGFALMDAAPDAVTLALLTGGYLDLRPAGVRLLWYATPSVADAPLFAFDSPPAGFDAGCWARILAPTGETSDGTFRYPPLWK
jgi:hypothetical protein